MSILETQITANLVTEAGDNPLKGTPEQIGRYIADACLHDPNVAYSHRLDILEPAQLPTITTEDVEKIKEQVANQVLGAAFFLAEAGLASLAEFGIKELGESIIEYLTKD